RSVELRAAGRTRAPQRTLLARRRISRARRRCGRVSAPGPRVCTALPQRPEPRALHGTEWIARSRARARGARADRARARKAHAGATHARRYGSRGRTRAERNRSARRSAHGVRPGTRARRRRARRRTPTRTDTTLARPRLDHRGVVLTS